MTTHFYVDPEGIREDELVLSPEESLHACKVLRHRLGDEIIAVDGVGGWYRAEITQLTASQVRARVCDVQREVGEHSLSVTVGLGILKKAARFEMALEKCVELGVARIQPLITERTERDRIKEPRLTKMLIAAMKQSGRSRMPELLSPVRLSDFLKGRDGLGLVCHEDGSRSGVMGLQDLSLAGRHAVTAAIGPEGGFSEEEVDLAVSLDWQVVHLGPRRLRAETAAIAVATYFSLT